MIVVLDVLSLVFALVICLRVLGGCGFGWLLCVCC